MSAEIPSLVHLAYCAFRTLRRGGAKHALLNRLGGTANFGHALDKLERETYKCDGDFVGGTHYTFLKHLSFRRRRFTAAQPLRHRFCPIHAWEHFGHADTRGRWTMRRVNYGRIYDVDDEALVSSFRFLGALQFVTGVPKELREREEKVSPLI
jgi:hypothetical protein